jgi:hypothetical protein
MSALFLIYIFRNIQDREECFTSGYSWKDGEGNSCSGSLNTNTELMTKMSAFNEKNYNRFDNIKVYKKDNLKNPSHHYRQYCDVMTFNDLLAYKCLNKSPMELRAVFESSVNIASSIDYIYLYNDTTLYSFILSKIQSTKEKLGNKIVGPVYVCISQAPYLRSVIEKTDLNNIDKWNDAVIDILAQKKSYYFDKTSSSGVTTSLTDTSDGTDTFATTSKISSLYCHILIVYPAYTKAMVLKETTITRQPIVIKQFLEQTMASYYTNNELCFLKCNKAINLNCGCLTRSLATSTASPAGTLNSYFDNTNEARTINEGRDKPIYQSKCLDNSKNNAEGNFTMMYYVNPYSDNYGDKNIIKDPEEDFPDEKCGA